MTTALLNACGASAGDNGDGNSGEQVDASSEEQPRADSGVPPRADAMPQGFGSHIIDSTCFNQQEGIRIAISDVFQSDACYPEVGVDSYTLVLGLANASTGQTFNFGPGASDAQVYFCPGAPGQNCSQITSGSIVFEAFSQGEGASGIFSYNGNSVEFNASWCGAYEPGC